MNIKNLISKENLHLAWNRIKAGDNRDYKKFFRNIYYAYELSVDKNIDHLYEILKGGAYKPQFPTRIFLPKPSGLQRPITLLFIEDQIVYQAIANIYINSLSQRRKILQEKTIFSNIITDDTKSQFILKNWKNTYPGFKDKIYNLYENNYKWVAKFDLSAFYDTISHDLLLKILNPRKEYESKNDLIKWLNIWSSIGKSSSIGHGIPQGPIASNILSDFFMLPVDEILSKKYAYLRYVDDIRILGKSESEVRKATIELEILCRNRGLIPQGDKYSIFKAKNKQEALGSLPSIITDFNEINSFTKKEKLIKYFYQSLSKNKKDITDKTRFKYILYHCGKDTKVLNTVLRLMQKYPEYLDAINAYLSQYQKSTKILNAAIQYLKDTPYDYVAGEMWHIIARIANKVEKKQLIEKAILSLKKEKDFNHKWGLLHFIISCDKDGLGNYSNFLTYQKNPLHLSLLASYIPEKYYIGSKLINQIFKRSSFEAIIVYVDLLSNSNINFKQITSDYSKLPIQVINTMESLGLLEASNNSTDVIGIIISKRFGIPKYSKWRNIFEKEYSHAVSHLKTADANYYSGKNHWLQYINSFNQILFYSIQSHLAKHKLPGLVTLENKKGELISFGNLLQKNNQFEINYPEISLAFRNCNDRRNKIPASHPYETKTKSRTLHLKSTEQESIRKELSIAYSKIITLYETIVNCA